MRSAHDLAVAVCVSFLLFACDHSAAPSSQGGPPPGASSAAPKPVIQAILTVDAAHDVIKNKGAPHYTIAPSDELVLELGDYRFSARDAGSVTPDAVHVAHGSSGYYRESFKGTRATLGALSLETVKGREAFPGFEAGESYVVAIGTETISPSDGAMGFAPAWTAMIAVDAK